MPRIATPKTDEPIRLVLPTATTERPEGSRGRPASTAPRYKVVMDIKAPGTTKRRQVQKTFKTLPEARAYVTQVRHEQNTGTFTAPNAETVEEAVTRWLASLHDVREVTREGYRNQIAPVLRHLGSRKVQSLTIADVDGLIVWMTTEGGKRGQGLGTRSVRAALVALGQVLDMLVREGALPKNVVRLTKKPRARKVVGTDLEHWEPADLLKFSAHADTDPLAAAWRLTVSGLTRADVMGLRWVDVDLEAGTATIAQGRVSLTGGSDSLVDDPKSEQRRRTVPFEVMWPGTVALLKALKVRQAADRLAAGEAWTESGYVVVDEVGVPLRPEVYSDRFRRLCPAAGVPSIRLHSVRHSLAFWLHSAEVGVSPADAAALLGHTVEVHLATYLPASGSAGIERAAEALGRSARSRRTG